MSFSVRREAKNFWLWTDFDLKSFHFEEHQRDGAKWFLAVADAKRAIDAYRLKYGPLADKLWVTDESGNRVDDGEIKDAKFRIRRWTPHVWLETYPQKRTKHRSTWCADKSTAATFTTLDEANREVENQRSYGDDCWVESDVEGVITGTYVQRPCCEWCGYQPTEVWLSKTCPKCKKPLPPTLFDELDELGLIDLTAEKKVLPSRQQRRATKKTAVDWKVIANELQSAKDKEDEKKLLEWFGEVGN